MASSSDQPVFEFIDKDGKQIKYEFVQDRVRKFIDNEMLENKITMLSFYKTSSQFMDYSDWNYHHWVTNLNPIETSKQLQQFCAKYDISLVINGYKWSNKSMFCPNDDVELIFKCKKQLQRLHGHTADKNYNDQYICCKCNGSCSVNLGSFHCATCRNDVCPTCYLGIHNTRKCGEDLHHPNAFVMTVARMVQRVAFCNICLSRCNLNAVCFCCVPCIGYNFYALCMKCYTFGKILICQNGHPLSYHNKDELSQEGYSTTFQCADCMQHHESTYGAYHCPMCSYDLCPVCYFTEREKHAKIKEHWYADAAAKEESKQMEETKEETAPETTLTVAPSTESMKCYLCCSELNAQTNASRGEKYVDKANNVEIIYEDFCKECFELIKFLFETGAKDGQGIAALDKHFQVNTPFAFKEEYKQYMPPTFFCVSRSRAATWINYNRVGWCFNETQSSRLKDHVCFVKIKVDKLMMDEDFETEKGICTATIRVRYYWLFSKADYELFRGKRVDYENKRKWTRFEPGRPWEPKIEFVTPAVGKCDQTPQDIEFSTIPVADYFGDDLLSEESKQIFAKSIGYLRSIEHEFEVVVEEPFELESYPFDSQDIPITISASNFSGFSPALDFAQSGGNEPVILLDGDAVTFGDWNAVGALVEFPRINDKRNEMEGFEPNEMSIRLKLKRKWKLALMKKVFVIFCITLLSLSIFVFDLDDAETKLSIVAGLILVLIFLEMPDIPIFSLLHWYFYASFGYLVLMAVQSAAAGMFTQEHYDLVMYAFIGVFVVYHIIFTILAIQTLWREHRKLFMNTATVHQSVEWATKSYDVYSTLDTEYDMIHYATTGINGLFTELPSFCCGKRGGLKKGEQTVYQSVPDQMEEHIELTNQ